jgi:hypothetical protein
MSKYLFLTGSISGSLGALIGLFSGLARVLGFYYIAGFQSTTLFNIGVGLMVFACLVKLDKLLSSNGNGFFSGGASWSGCSHG